MASRLLRPIVGRAVEGVLEPVYQRGEQVGTVRRYRDTLLIFLLKGNQASKFADRREVTGKDGGPVQVRQEIDPTALSDAELEQLESILARITAPAADGA